MSILRTIKTYFILTKPRLWLLLVYTGMAGYVIASNGFINPQIFTILLISLISGTAGANTITSYIDRDIDAIMVRTKNRPLPRGDIDPPIKALYFGCILAGIAIVTSWMLNLLALAFMLFGLFDNIVIYSYLTKRRTPWNIILGSFSGGAPAVIGYVTYTNQFTLEALILAAFIVIWTPIHIWSLALFYRDDYRKAGVPMLPAVVDESKAIKCIGCSAIILIFFSLILPILDSRFLTPVYIIPVVSLDALIAVLSAKLILRPRMRTSWVLFKLTSPYLAIVFTLGILCACMH